MTADSVRTRKPPWWLLARSIPGVIAFVAAWACFSMNPIGVQLRRDSDVADWFVWTGISLAVLTLAGAGATIVALRKHPEWVDPARGSTDRRWPWAAWIVGTVLALISVSLLVSMIFTRSNTGLGTAQMVTAMAAFLVFLYVGYRGSSRSIFT